MAPLTAEAPLCSLQPWNSGVGWLVCLWGCTHAGACKCACPGGEGKHAEEEEETSPVQHPLTCRADMEEVVRSQEKLCVDAWAMVGTCTAQSACGHLGNATTVAQVVESIEDAW